jgi:hypothetical protein
MASNRGARSGYSLSCHCFAKLLPTWNFDAGEHNAVVLRSLYSSGRYLVVAFFVLFLVIVVWAAATRPQRQAAASVTALINSIDAGLTASQFTTLNQEVDRREIALGADPLDTNGVLYKLEKCSSRALDDWTNQDPNQLRADLSLVRSNAVQLRDEGPRPDLVTPPEISTRNSPP